MTPSDPRRGLVHGLAALVLFAPLLDGGTTYLPATVIRLGALVCAGLWLLRALRPSGGWRHPTPLDLPLLLFLALAALSTLTSSHRYESLQAFLSLATGALVFGVATEVARERPAARILTGAVVAGGLAQALLALLQWALGATRAAGTYFNPNHLAMALVMTGALLLALRPASRLRAALAWAGLALVAFALLASRSRGGVLAAAFAWGLVGWHRWRWRAVTAGAVAALLVVALPNPVGLRFRNLHADPLAYSRLQVWRSALERTRDHPFGVGLNLFKQSSQQYAFPVEGEIARYGRRAESAHSEYLEILAELGIPGLLIGLWGGALLARRAARELRARAARAGGPVGAPSPPDQPLAVGAAGALAGLAAQAVVDVPLAVPAVVVQAAVLAGVLLAGPASPAGAGPVTVPAGFHGPAARLAAGLLCLLAAAGVARHGAAFLAGQRAAAARDSGDIALARRWLERAVAFAPESAGYSDALAAASVMAWRASRDPADAVAAEQMMLRAMRLDPDDAARYARLAQVYREITPADPAVRRRALMRAKALYEQAERLDPHTAQFAFERAEILLKLEDPNGAEAALSRAVALEPRFLPARLNLARLLARRGDRAGAAAQYAVIEATLEAYPRLPAIGPFAAAFLGVDRQVVRREAAALREGAS